jgi:nanoRNase/pAp phosphatase (c-di-AMP/oligoRNAs hydrolase)
MMMRAILKPFGFREVELSLPGAPDNFVQNTAIVNQFALAEAISVLNKDFDSFVGSDDLLVFVDTPSVNDARFPIPVMPRPHIVIDHHARPSTMIEQNDREWYWYEGCGACASMVTALFIELDTINNIDAKELRRVATLAVIGVVSDSKKLTSRHTRPVDYEMAAFLSPYADQDKIHQISSSRYTESFLDVLGIQRERWRIEGHTMLFRVGGPDSQRRTEDNMLKATELLMNLRGIETLYVWMLVGDRILIKARNFNKGLDLDVELKRIFGQNNGGAKDKSLGAASMDIGALANVPKEKRDVLLGLCDSLMQAKIFGN